MSQADGLDPEDRKIVGRKLYHEFHALDPDKGGDGVTLNASGATFQKVAQEVTIEAFGKMNVAKGIDMPKDAIFRIASMTKPMTSLAVTERFLAFRAVSMSS